MTDSVLSEAASIVDGPRRAFYGHPVDNHGTTAAMWAAYLAVRFQARPDEPLGPRDVCLLNVLQKVARDAHRPKRDNLVDVAGYVRNAELVEEELARRRWAEAAGAECSECDDLPCPRHRLDLLAQAVLDGAEDEPETAPVVGSGLLAVVPCCECGDPGHTGLQHREAKRA